MNEATPAVGPSVRKRVLWGVAIVLLLLTGGFCLWYSLAVMMVESLVLSLPRDHISVAYTAYDAKLVGAGRLAVRRLLDALEDDNPTVRWNAGNSLGAFRPAPDRVVPRFIELLQHDNPGVRWEGARLLGKTGPAAVSAVPALIAVMEEERATQVPGPGAVIYVMDKSEYAAYPKSHSVRSAAAEALGKIGPAARPAVPHLRKALQDPDGAVRLHAAVALWKIDGKPDPVVPALMEALGDEKLRSGAAQALGEIGPDAKAAVPKLIASLRDTKGKVNRSVVDALGQFGAEAKAAVPSLKEALKDEDEYVVRDVARTLLLIDPE